MTESYSRTLTSFVLETDDLGIPDISDLTVGLTEDGYPVHFGLTPSALEELDVLCSTILVIPPKDTDKLPPEEVLRVAQSAAGFPQYEIRVSSDEIDAVAELYLDLDPGDWVHRFTSERPDEVDMAKRIVEGTLTAADAQVVVTSSETNEVVAHGQIFDFNSCDLSRRSPETQDFFKAAAEAACCVASDHKRQGIGKVVAGCLNHVAAEAGFDKLTANITTDNPGSRHLALDYGGKPFVDFIGGLGERDSVTRIAPPMNPEVGIYCTHVIPLTEAV